MQVAVESLGEFVHGNRTFMPGAEAMLEQTEAEDLERAGLVRVKMAKAPANKMMKPHEGKAEAAGRGAASASSQAAQASAKKTPTPAKSGKTKGKTGI